MKRPLAIFILMLILVTTMFYIKAAGIRKAISGPGSAAAGTTTGTTAGTAAGVASGMGVDTATGMPTAMPADRSLFAQGLYGYHADLMARLIQGEAATEPYIGKVAIGAVVMNRLDSPLFPKTIPGVIFEPDAFESVSNGLIWRIGPSAESYRASQDALSGWDPTGGALFFFNPAKPVSWWIWTRPPVTRIGNHLFLR